MEIATGIIAGLLILGVGGAIASSLGFFLLGLGGELVKPARVTNRTALAGGISAVFGLMVLIAGPLASLWAGIAVAVNIIGG